MISVLLVVAVFLGIIYVIIFNGLVHARQKVKESWSGIDVQLKRRYDLIPNLIKTVQGYAQHEKTLLEKITAARAQAIAVPSGKIAEQAKAENMITEALRSVFAVAENYPNLKANENFLNLQEQLGETEDQIAAARRIYNGNATILNTKVQSFPSNVVAGIHGFFEEEFFELEDAEAQKAKETPKVQF